MNRFTIAAAFLASTAGLAHAINFTGTLAPNQWSGNVSSTPANIFLSQGSPDTLGLNYNFDGNFNGAVTGCLADFWVTADTTTPLSFDYNVTGFHSWISAYSYLAVFADGPDGRVETPLINYVAVSGPFSISGVANFDVHAGYIWGVRVLGVHNDSLYALNGVVTLSNLVPTPGAGMLATTGGLMLVRRRR